jgi:hypothetical protein
VAGQMGVSNGPMQPNGPGGYQAPQNPAPASGPSGLSQRTDGGPQQAMQQLSGAKYGEQKSFQQAQAGAPMAASPSPGQPSTAGSGAGPAMPHGGAGAVTPFTAPTARPGEPVTSGAARGPGPGTAALNLPPTTNKQDYVALRPALPALQFLANMPGSSPGIKQFVRYMQSGGLGAGAQGQSGSQLQ